MFSTREFLDKVLADGEFHSDIELHQKLSTKIPPELAIRTCEKRRDSDRRRRHYGVPERPFDIVEAIRRGARTRLRDYVRSVVQAGRAERVILGPDSWLLRLKGCDDGEKQDNVTRGKVFERRPTALNNRTKPKNRKTNSPGVALFDSI